MGFHIAVTDLREGGSLEELARLPEQGVTSYKLFMAYKGALMVDDETLFRTMEVAAETGALVMVHAENGDAIDVLVKQALAAGNTAPHFHALTRPPETRRRGDEPRDPARARRRRAALRRPRLVQGGGRPDRARARAGLGRLGRDVHAVLLHRLHVPRAARLRGREVRLHAAAARDREPGGPLARRALGHPLGDLDRPLRVSLGRPEVDRADDFSKIPNGGPGLENRLHMIHEFGVRTGRHLAEPDGRAARDEPGEAVRPLPAEGHDRAGLGRGHRDLRPREAAPDHGGDAALEGRTTTSTRAPRSRGRRRPCSSAGTCSSRVASSSRSRVSASSSSGPPSGRSSCPQPLARRSGCAEERRTPSPLSGATAQCLALAVRRACDVVDRPHLSAEGDDIRGVADDLERRRLIELVRDRREAAGPVRPHERSGVV